MKTAHMQLSVPKPNVDSESTRGSDCVSEGSSKSRCQSTELQFNPESSPYLRF